MAYLLGIDNGLTVSKAVLFDDTGRAINTARRRIPQSMPAAHFVERDMTVLWLETAAAIGEVLSVSGVDAADVSAIAATAHGDGLYLIDDHARPLRPGILSLDSRAGAIVDRWTNDRTAEDALARTGQVPHASAPSALLAWVRDNEPDVYQRIGTILAAKDWLRLCLTGTVGTDLTEASTSFTDVRTQAYADDILQIFGLEALASALPDVSAPSDVVGHVTTAAAQQTGLAEGTPVVAGLHDVTASALGVGGYAERIVAIVAGTYSINETVTHAPKTDPAWFCRNGIALGEWNNMAISPASAANYDWFLDALMSVEREGAGNAIHTHVAEAIAKVERSNVLFHPYLFGSPHGPTASASFLGLRGWHGRPEMLRAVIEGIAFNHRVHVDALRGAFEVEGARLTGGISRNPVFSQIFADALGLPVVVTDTEEAAAWGTALCAGAGVGLFDSPKDDPRELEQTTYHPDPARTHEMDELFALHLEVGDAIGPIWRKLEQRGSAS
ncbi:MAG: FGGY-family carbohydrate kinase [Pseudomonadota bacterium]